MSYLPQLDGSLNSISLQETEKRRFGASAKTAMFLWHQDRLQRLIGQHDFMWFGAVQVQTNRKAIAIYYQHHLADIANFGLTCSGAPLYAGTKLPSRKACANSSFPWASSLLNKNHQMSSQVLSSDHGLSHR